MTTEEKLKKIREIVEEAVFTDGEHHKQWYLVQIGDIIGIDVDLEEEDKGMPA